VGPTRWAIWGPIAGRMAQEIRKSPQKCWGKLYWQLDSCRSVYSDRVPNVLILTTQWRAGSEHVIRQGVVFEPPISSDTQRSISVNVLLFGESTRQLEASHSNRREMLLNTACASRGQRDSPQHHQYDAQQRDRYSIGRWGAGRTI
jgi:hypothetical protein